MPRPADIPELYPQTCPTCGGAMLDTEVNGQPGFQCHIGHSFDLPTMDEAQVESVEQVLTLALRIMHERAGFCGRVAGMAALQDRQEEATRWTELRREVELRMEVVQRLLDYGWSLTPEDG